MRMQNWTRLSAARLYAADLSTSQDVTPRFADRTASQNWRCAFQSYQPFDTRRPFPTHQLST